MKKVDLLAYAKINLYLDVVSKRDDGYHNIESVMQSVSLADEVSLDVECCDGVEINQCFENSDLPCDETNLCYKAAKAYINYFNIDNIRVSIRVNKQIPAQAGLAGGSADAAAVIRALDTALGKGSDVATLSEIGLSVGSDVGFCIYGGTCAVEGRGELIEPLKKLDRYWLVIAKSYSESVSTSLAYLRIDNKARTSYPQASFVDYVNAVNEGNSDVIENGMYNIFRDVMSDELKETYQIIEAMKKNGSLGAQMSGSGPSVFGLFDCVEKAEAALGALNGKCFAVVCHTV